MKKLKQVIIAAAMAFTLLAPVVSIGAVSAQASGNVSAVCDGVELTGGNCNPGGSGGLNDIITKGVDILSIIIGVVAVVMIMVGGLKYITSGGDANSITGAKNTILYAIIGLVVVALAQIIVKFVLAKVNNATS